MKNLNLNSMGNECDDILGDVEYHHEFYSRYLKNERDIIVWLPPSYAESRKSYPVIYMHDGQNLFSPSTSFAGFDWKVDETLTNLIKNKLIEEVIVVGVFNTRDRLEEYNFFTSKGKKYSFFLINELKEFIDENYRTKPDAKNCGVIGSSMGGLISFQLCWNFPKIFGKGACISNSFWIDDGEVFNMVEKDENKLKDIKLYLDCGDAEKELIDDNKKMNDILIKIGYKKNENYMFHIEKDAVHNEKDWAARFHLPMKFLFGRYND